MKADNVVTSQRTGNAGGTRARATAPPPARQPVSIVLTGRGGIAAIFVVELVARLLATQISLGALPGVLFVVVCSMAAFMTRRSDQLILVVSPPLIFFLVTMVAEFVKAMHDSSVLVSAGSGLLLALASDAPWLFLATALTIGIAMTRGLPGNVTDLRRRLAAASGGPRPARPSKPSAVRRLGSGSRRKPADDDFDEDPVRWDVSP